MEEREAVKDLSLRSTIAKYAILRSLEWKSGPADHWTRRPDLDLMKAWVRAFQVYGFEDLRKETWRQSIVKATVSGSYLFTPYNVRCTYTFKIQILVVNISQSLLRDSSPLISARPLFNFVIAHVKFAQSLKEPGSKCLPEWNLVPFDDQKKESHRS